MPRDLFETELAGRAAIFRSDGENFFRSQGPELVNIVAGDPSRIPDLISFCLDSFEQWLARYLAKEEFKVDTAVYERMLERITGSDKDDELDTEEDEAV